MECMRVGRVQLRSVVTYCDALFSGMRKAVAGKRVCRASEAVLNDTRHRLHSLKCASAIECSSRRGPARKIARTRLLPLTESEGNCCPRLIYLLLIFIDAHLLLELARCHGHDALNGFSPSCRKRFKGMATVPVPHCRNTQSHAKGTRLAVHSTSPRAK